MKREMKRIVVALALLTVGCGLPSAPTSRELCEAKINPTPYTVETRQILVEKCVEEMR